VFPLGLELLFLAGILALAALALWRPPAAGPREPPPGVAWLAALSLFGVALLPVAAGGLLGKIASGHHVYYTNYGVYLLSDWVAENVGPEDRLLLMPRTHLTHLIGLPKSRMLRFAEFETQDLETLRGQLPERGVTLVVFTDRGAVRNPAQGHYYRLHNAALAEHFASGGPLPGFEHVVTLPLPAELERRPVQIYRVEGAGLAGSAPGG
jgi:hypothetical protein